MELGVALCAPSLCCVIHLVGEGERSAPPSRNAHFPSSSPYYSLSSSYHPFCFLRREMPLSDHPLSSPKVFRPSVPTSRMISPFPLEGSGLRGRRSSNRDKMDDEEKEEEGEPGFSSSSFLSLSEKPDLSLALLDHYKLEELDSDEPSCPPNHRSGYVAVMGKPNVGRSTLSNQMIGQKLSIVTEKPQTTRHRILGICSGPEYQMILYDTPGFIEKKMHMLDSMMMKNVKSAAINADCVHIVVDATKMPEKWYQKFTEADDVIPVSAKYGRGVKDVKDWILSKLPFGPAYYLRT